MDSAGMTSSLTESFTGLWQAVIAHLPRIAMAAVVLIAGWGIALLLRLLVTRLGRRLPRLFPGRAIGRELKESGAERIVSDVVGSFAFWAVFLLFVAAAGHIVGLGMIPAALSQLVQYLPSLLAAALVVFAGTILGKLARDGIIGAASRARIAQGAFLGQAARVTILVVTAVVALDQIGIESTLPILILGIVLGTVIGGVALAFGLGARDSVSGFIASQEISQSYKIGDRVSLGDVEGKIIRFTRTAVYLDTPRGRARMPATEFCGRTSILLEPGRQP